ncbi:MAG: VWA domain-containing protein [Eubacteriaceae bacterium]|nr:VWA domain-containing protein [Eubacteriaceae bacterium]
MFIKFMYALRGAGLKVSLDEWLVLMEALDAGLAGNSLMEFYYLARNILVKRESDYDKFDMGFMEYFRNIQTISDLPPEFMEWLSQDELERDLADMPEGLKKHDLNELLQMFKERLKEQKEKHDGGNYWVGTGGTSPFGHGGYNPQGVRVGGEGRHQSAVQIAGERKFRDFRQDNELNIRQFQMAFRKLRQFSSRIDSAKTELDINETIKATGDNAGMLTLVYEKPRKNTVKLLLLIDSDGSMWRHTQLVNQLFQALHQSTHLKDLKTYYFHNCIYENLYTTPACRRGDWVETDWVLGNYGSEYKVILVGDASMSTYELMAPGGNINWYDYNEEPGIQWLGKIQRHFDKSIWLNPIKEERWEYTRGYRTIHEIRNVFPMFELTLDGLDKGISKLL